jgi:aminoglycoside phosphotransferase (APT) family kinase protein
MNTLEPAVLAWVNRVLRPDEVIGVERLAGGYTNLNLAITTNNSRYVLRHYRRSVELAGRTCAIEVALARRLGGTAVPVAEVIAADPSGAAQERPCSRKVPHAPTSWIGMEVSFTMVPSLHPKLRARGLHQVP